MGGGNKFHYPKWVWTPTGGWWANPRNWRRNTFATAFCLVAFCQFVVIPWSDAHTVGTFSLNGCNLKSTVFFCFSLG